PPQAVPEGGGRSGASAGPGDGEGGRPGADPHQPAVGESRANLRDPPSLGTLRAAVRVRRPAWQAAASSPSGSSLISCASSGAAGVDGASNSRGPRYDN